MFFGNTQDPSSAFAAFDKNTIIECCINYLNKRKRRIQREIEEAVQEEMTDKRSWFSRMILRERGPAATREEAIERIQKSSKEFLSFSIWDQIHDYGRLSAEKVEHILSMAENSTMPYVVLGDKGQFILNYKEVSHEQATKA